MTRQMKHRFIGTLLGATALMVAPAALAEIDAEKLHGLSARAIGPATTSGRIAAVDAVVSNPNVIVTGTATGGVWKSTNGGLNWTPIFDKEDVASIGAVAINQEHPDVIWVGTGEGNVRNSTSIGGGMYKSTDGGVTWKNVGLKLTERINRIALDPDDPDVAYAAAMGTLWGKNKERGIYKTTDGGTTWKKILYVDDTTGATDIKMDPTNPNKLYAGMWEFARKPYRFDSGGKGSAMYISKDAGETWEKQTTDDGMPEGDLGRMVIAVAPSKPNTVYALVEAKKSALLRSDDGGESWKTVNDEPNITTRPFYYSELLVDPKDENTVYNIFTFLHRSIDGGKSFQKITSVDCCAPGNTIHIDNHTLWANPADPDHLILGNDGGLAVTRDKGETWRFIQNLPLAQFYHINVDNQHPYNIYGGLQDNGTWFGPAEVWDSAGIRNVHWQEIGFGDGFDAMADPVVPNQGYSMSQGGNLSRWNLDRGEQRLIKPASPADVELRFNWNAGLAQDPFDPATIYYGSQFLHKSTDRGNNWDIISGDLTTNNPDWQTYKSSGGITPDVTAAENYTSISAVAASAVKEGVIWVGSDDGLVHVTADGGQTWTNASTKGKGPKNAWISHIEPSPHDASVAFVILDNHRNGDMAPHAYKVSNYGKKWQSITTKDVKGYALTIQQDHVDPNLLFLGTEFGLFASTSGGKSWFKWTEGVPTVSVMDLAIQERENDLVLGTHGRSIFVIDDYSALRGLNEKDFKTKLKILGTTNGQQYSTKRAPSTRFWGSAGFVGENEKYGAFITFIATPGDKEKKATITVKNAEGDVIRTFKADVKEGLNRVAWDMRRDGIAPMAPRKMKDDVLPAGREVLPGTYTVAVKLGDSVQESAVTVLADPRQTLSMDDRVAKAALADRLSALSAKANEMVGRIYNARADVNTLKALATRAKEGADEARGEKLTAFTKAVDEALEMLKEQEEVYRTPPKTIGIVYDDHRVTSKIGMARYHSGSNPGRPSKDSLTYTVVAEKALEEALGASNETLMKSLGDLKSSASELGLGLLSMGEAITMPVSE